MPEELFAYVVLSVGTTFFQGIGEHMNEPTVWASSTMRSEWFPEADFVTASAFPLFFSSTMQNQLPAPCQFSLYHLRDCVSSFVLSRHTRRLSSFCTLAQKKVISLIRLVSHTTSLNQWLVSITKPQERLLCEMCLYFMFAQVPYTQNRFKHVDYMEIVSFRLTTNFQPDLSLSVLLERFSVSTSESSRTIRLLQLGFPKPLGTQVDRGSAVDHHQSVLTLSATILAQGYVTDHAVNREQKLFSSLAVDVLDSRLARDQHTLSLSGFPLPLPLPLPFLRPLLLPLLLHLFLLLPLPLLFPLIM